MGRLFGVCLSGITCLGLALPLQGEQKWALLVGINEYQGPSEWDLKGCVNDVHMTREVLVTRFGFPEENIKILLNAQATVGNIRQAIEDWLIARPQPEDIVYFHFSGHGSQVKDRDGDEDDGKDELLCPADMQMGVLRSVLTDDQLKALFARIRALNVTIVLDACHSGTGTRDLSLSRPRFVEFEAGLEEGDLTRAVVMPPTTGPDTALIAPPKDKLSGSGGIESGAKRQVTISGCKPEETSADAWIRDDFYAGALTYHWIENLKKAPGNLTYRQVMERVVRDIKAASYRQTPQFEGDMDRPVLGTPVSTTPSTPPVAVQVAQEKLNLLLEAEEGAVKEAVQQALGRIEFVAVVDSGQHFDHRLHIEAAEGLLKAFLTLDGRPATPVTGEDVPHLVEALRPQLENAYAIKVLARLDNPSPPFKVEVWANRARPGERDLVVEQLDASPDEKLVEARVGDVLRFNFRAERDCYLTLINVGTSGKITILFPNEYQPDGLVRGGRVYRTETKGEMPFRIRAKGPPGRELVKVIATVEPLELSSLRLGRAGEGGTRSMESGSRFAHRLARDLTAVGAEEHAEMNGEGAAASVLLPGAGWTTDYLMVETLP